MQDVTPAGRPGTTDADLARAIASRAPGAATAEEAELYRRFAPRVRLYGLKHLRDAAAADDLVQQVMLAVIERLRAGAVRNPDGIASFVLGTSRLIAGAQQRTARRRDALLSQFAWSAATAVDARDERIDLDRLERCLHALPERDRTVVILTFYAEAPSIDIATAIGCTAGAVRVARHRALLRLRRCVTDGTAA